MNYTEYIANETVLNHQPSISIRPVGLSSKQIAHMKEKLTDIIGIGIFIPFVFAIRFSFLLPSLFLTGANDGAAEAETAPVQTELVAPTAAGENGFTELLNQCFD